MSNEAEMMKKKSKRTLIPKLRFPEFRKEPGWKERPLSDVLLEHGHKSTGSEEVFSVSVHKGLINQIEHLGRSFSASSTDHYNRVLPGDVVYTKSPTGDFPLGIIKQNKLDVSVIVSPLYGVFSPETTALGAILDAYFESPANAKRFLEPLVQKGAKNTINIKNGRFLSGTLILPVDKEEQQKIADCLSSLDRVIAAEGRTLEALKAHKKGLMQQLFPQPGQTQPRLRFPEFRDKGDWKEKPLGKIAEIKLGKMLDKNKHRSGRLLPYLNNLAVRWNDFDTSNLPEMYFDDDELEKYKLTKGDVLVCEGGEPGRSAVWDERLPDLKFQKALHRVRFKIQFVPHLLVHYLETISGTSAFESLFTGGGIKHLTLQTFACLAIPIASPSEQQRIADCLAALDTRIAAQAAKIESLKQHKRGLMQQLFPAPEEQ